MQQQRVRAFFALVLRDTHKQMKRTTADKSSCEQTGKSHSLSSLSLLGPKMEVMDDSCRMARQISSNDVCLGQLEWSNLCGMGFMWNGFPGRLFPTNRRECSETLTGRT